MKIKITACLMFFVILNDLHSLQWKSTVIEESNYLIAITSIGNTMFDVLKDHSFAQSTEISMPSLSYNSQGNCKSNRKGRIFA